MCAYVGMHVCTVFVCTRVCTCVCADVGVCVCTVFMCTRVCAYVGVRVCTVFVCTCVCTVFVWTRVCMCMRVCTYVGVCVCVHSLHAEPGWMMGRGRGRAAGRRLWTVPAGGKQVAQGGHWGPRCCHLPHVPTRPTQEPAPLVFGSPP